MVWTARPGGEWDFANRPWLEFTGLSLEHVQAAPTAWTTALHPEDAGDAGRTYLERVASGLEFSMESRLRRADGTYRWFLSRATPLVDADGTVAAFLGIFVDIDDLKSAQQSARDRAQALEEAVASMTAELRETIAELEALSYGVAHDMRAPLRAIRGYAELLLGLRGGRLDEQAQVYLHKITGAARRLDSLIDDVITYTGRLRAELALEPIELEPMLREVLRDFPKLTAGGASIVIDGPLPRVLGHEASLAQCFEHVLSNAVKFAAPGVPARIRVYAEERTDDVRVWVEDNGIGIAPHDQARIFNPFERVGNSDAPGAGIGLAIVRKTLQRAKGGIGVESVPGRGSRFWIQLPRPQRNP
jgi:PAS domain S-box-containing protein